MVPIARSITHWLSGLSIRNRLIVYLLIGIIPILLITVYFFREAYSVRRQQVLLGNMATAQATAGTVREFVEGILRAHDIIALNLAREQLDYVQMDAYFEQARQAVPIMETLGFALPSGLVISGTPIDLVGANVSDLNWFQSIRNGSSSAVSELLPARPEGDQAFIVAHRVETNGRLTGVLFSAISPEALGQFVARRSGPEIGYGILDSRGHVIVSTIVRAETIAENRDRSSLYSVGRALRGEPTFAPPFIDPADGVRRMGASVPIIGIGWVVNVFQPVSEAMAPVRRAAFIDLVLNLLVLALLLFAVWILGTNLTRPIRSLARKAEAVGHGDFSQRMQTADQSEVGILAGAFNDMTAQLERFREEERKDREFAHFLADVGELLTSSLDPKVILQTIVEKTVQCVGDIAIIFRYEPDQPFIPIAIHAAEQELFERARKLVTESPPTLGVGTVGAAVKEGRTVLVRHISEMHAPEVKWYMEKVGVVSAIAVPMRVHGQITGAFLVASAEKSLSEEEVSILDEVGRRVGIALENIRLYEEALERERFQKGLTDLAAAVSLTLEPGIVLNSICEQAKFLLNVDGVYIWTIQEEERKLIARAGCGFNAAEFQGVTLPLDRTSLAPVRALISRQGFFRHNVPAWPDSPLAERFQVKADMFQPLISGGTHLGVMVFTDSEDTNRFDAVDLNRSRLISGYAATALANARIYQRERRIAETLQRGLLPEVPDHLNGLEVAHYYSPARREAAIGGDFYDFIDVERQDCSGLVVGDVSGKGLEAAVVTAMAKYILRAYAAEDPEPYVVLARTNNAIAQYTGPELFITMIYGLLFTESRRFRYASAGHEPLLIYRTAEGKAVYQESRGLAAGVEKGQEFLTHEVILESGDMLVLYTDGLTDARSPEGELLGHEGLAAMVAEEGGQPAEAFLSKLIQRVRTYSSGEWTDDVAVLVIRAA